LVDNLFPQIGSYTGQGQWNLSEVMDSTERRIIVEALENHTGNRTQTAKSLGIARPTLILKMKKHNIM
jgi:transcriptional regulator with PAS, ATPase and Fis domain